ncbi:MAG TPA: protein-glutamate O-methyltransferase CheR [Polyangiaceae bacterium]|nr:protein-glutamate O-methyltransferase CheR [Polyangiaceae bacterium]
MSLSTAGVEQAEIEALVTAILQRYGYDFSHYARASFVRRVRHALNEEALPSVSALQAKLLRDPLAMRRFLTYLSVNVTAMFRDAEFYEVLRKQVIPWLRTYPFVRIWHAGCASGEEVYSMCILLEEEGIYDRCRIYATDLSEVVLHRARMATYPLSLVQRYTANYHKAGGELEFSRYYTADQENAIIHERLKKNVVFSLHNLASDGSFNEFHLVCCRNVMIYFDEVLQGRVLTLFDQSLSRGGYLALGRRETLRFSSLAQTYTEIEGNVKIYRKPR